MNNQQLKKLGLIVLVLFVVFLVVYAYQILRRTMSQLNQKTAVEPLNTATVAKKVAAARSCTKGNLFPLSKGSCGTKVTKLQNALNNKGHYSLDPDGIFGAQTEIAVISAFGRNSVSEQMLADYLKPVDNSKPTATEKETAYVPDTAPVKVASVASFATAIKTDLDTIYMLGGRKNVGIWAQTVALSDSDLKDVAQYIHNTFRLSFYDMVDKARWDVTDNVNLLLKNRLVSVGYGHGK